MHVSRLDEVAAGDAALAAAAKRVRAAADAARDGGRREGARTLPLGPKARRTRAALLRAAYERFEEAGYHQTSVSDIATAAGVSLGTFYQYFRDRADVMSALIGDVAARAVGRPGGIWDASTGLLGLRRVIASFVSTYAETARFQVAWEQVTYLDAELASLRRDLTRLYVAATEESLRKAQQEGRVRPSLDPAITAVALNAMVDRYCYLTYVFDPPARPPSVDEAVDELTRLWAEGIGLVDG
jgi:AcrR family transcriptional regulator